MQQVACVSKTHIVQHALLLADCRMANAGYSTVQGPSSPLVRPHPAVWRLIHGIIVLYLISLIFLLFQDAHDARLFLKVWTLKHAYSSDSQHHLSTLACTLCQGTLRHSCMWLNWYEVFARLYVEAGLSLLEYTLLACSNSSPLWVLTLGKEHTVQNADSISLARASTGRP